MSCDVTYIAALFKCLHFLSKFAKITPRVS
jgi:hypothetical protein